MKIYILFGVLLLTSLFGMSGCSVGGSDGEEEEQTETFEFRVSVSPEGAGTVTPGSRRFDSGSTITVEAIPSDGYSFSEWTGDQESSENPYSFDISENTEMTANFLASSSRYSTTLLVADTTDTLRYLELGQLEGAADGVDEQDEEVPPAPPEGVLYAYFRNDVDLAKDFRSINAQTHTWNLQLQPSTQDSLFFSWTIDEQSLNGSLTIRNEDSSVSADMEQTQELAIHKNEADHLLIEYQLND